MAITIERNHAMATTTRTTTATRINNAPLVQCQRPTRPRMSDRELRYREAEAQRAIHAQQRLEAEQRCQRIILTAIVVALVLVAMAGWLIENMAMAMAMAFTTC